MLGKNSQLHGSQAIHKANNQNVQSRFLKIDKLPTGGELMSI